MIENCIAVELKSEAFLFFQYRESVIHLLCWRQEFILQGDCCYRKDGPNAVPVFDDLIEVSRFICILTSITGRAKHRI